ncbi:hypothetical protein OAF58_00395 [bacterium]|nr:hypothetical protein [bacterium]
MDEKQFPSSQSVFGLAFGTILTIVLVPVLYSCFFNVSASESAE